MIELYNWSGEVVAKITVTPGSPVLDYNFVVRAGKLYEYAGESLCGQLITFHEVNPEIVLICQ
jgi:hypothetical protein